MTNKKKWIEEEKKRKSKEKRHDQMEIIHVLRFAFCSRISIRNYIPNQILRCIKRKAFVAHGSVACDIWTRYSSLFCCRQFQLFSIC